MKQSILKQFAIALAVLSGLSATLALVPTASTSAATTACVNREFSEGDLNDKCVGYLQRMLNGANKAKLAVDNDFGPKTETAVDAWQRRASTRMSNMQVDRNVGIEPIAGRQTWYTLCVEQSRYKTTAKAAGCGVWKKEIASQIKTFGTITKPKRVKSATASTSKSAKPCTKQTFSRSKPNRNSVCVHYIQNMLNIAQGTHIDTTAAFGTNTRTAVKAFQANANVKNEAAGVVGKKTWKELCHYSTGNSNSQAAYNKLKAKSGCGENA